MTAVPAIPEELDTVELEPIKLALGLEGAVGETDPLVAIVAVGLEAAEGPAELGAVGLAGVPREAEVGKDVPAHGAPSPPPIPPRGEPEARAVPSSLGRGGWPRESPEGVSSISGLGRLDPAHAGSRGLPPTPSRPRGSTSRDILEKAAALEVADPEAEERGPNPLRWSIRPEGGRNRVPCSDSVSKALSGLTAGTSKPSGGQSRSMVFSSQYRLRGS